MATWFTADHHFGHRNIIKFASRPFASVEAMDRAMIENWNARVAPDDTVYHLGDFSFGDQNYYLGRLMGKKHLIIGNHDHKKRRRFSASRWETITPMLTVKEGKDTLILCHYAMRVWSASHYGSIHLYGHSHGNLPGDNQSLDVGVDCWDFMPVSLEEIKGRLSRNPKRVELDHHQPKGKPQ